MCPALSRRAAASAGSPAPLRQFDQAAAAAPLMQAGASFQRLILEKNGLQMQQQPQAAAEAGLAAPDPRATDQGGGSAVGSSGSGSAGDSDEQVQAAPAAEERQAALAAEELQALQEGPSFAEDGEEGAGEQAWDEQQQRSGTAAAEQQVQGGEGGGEEAQAEVGQQGADEELEIWDSSIEEEQQQDSAQGSRHHRAPDQRQLRCAVVNNRPWHLDVAAGLAYAFQVRCRCRFALLIGSAWQDPQAPTTPIALKQAICLRRRPAAT